MRLAYVRAAVLSLLAGGFLTLGVLAGWPGAARAGTVKATAASPSTSASASSSVKATTTASTRASASASPNVNTATTCEVLPATSTPTPTPTPTTHPTKTPTPTPYAVLIVHLRLADRPGGGQHAEQDAEFAAAVESEPERRFGRAVVIVIVIGGVYVTHGLAIPDRLAVPDRLGVSVVVAEFTGGHRLRHPRRVHRHEPQ